MNASMNGHGCSHSYTHFCSPLVRIVPNGSHEVTIQYFALVVPAEGDGFFYGDRCVNVNIMRILKPSMEIELDIVDYIYNIYICNNVNPGLINPGLLIGGVFPQ